MINIHISHQTEDDGIVDKKIKAVAKEALSNLLVAENNEVEIIFVDEKEIKNLNEKYRKISKPTDVLSFPQTHFKSSKINILGSIIICPAIAEERKEPIEELVKHGILHLLGYDHETNETEWCKAAKIINSNF